jgi:hypothetical protein
MVWNILRPEYWILNRRLRATKPVVLVGSILVIGFVGWLIYDNLIIDILELLNTDEAVTVIASSLPMGLIFLLLIAMLGVGDVLHLLYVAPDMELLLTAPVSYRTIFLVKLLQCSRATLIPALGFGAFLLALGLAREAAASYYLLIVLLILAAMALTAAMIMILVILSARVLPAQKTQSWMPVVFTVAMFVAVLAQQSATEWFLGQAGQIKFLTDALLTPSQLAVVVAGFGGLALATSLVAYWIFDTAFHEGWGRFREVPTRRVHVSPGARRRWGVSQLVRPLPDPLRSFLIKEWLELKRSPRDILALAQPLVLVGAIIVAPLLRKGGGSEMPQPLLFGFMVMLLAGFLGMYPIGTTLMALAQEGHEIALLRTAPTSMSDVLKGKFWGTWIPMVLFWVLVILIVGVGLHFPLWQIGFLMGMAIWGLAGASVATLAIGGIVVKFTAEDLRKRVSVLISYLMIGLNSVFVLLTISTCTWLMIRLFPDSSVVMAIKALAGFGAVGWFFSDSLWIPFSLVGGQVVFWIGMKVLWDAAVRRLEGWEES